jgi:hypothetical protein
VKTNLTSWLGVCLVLALAGAPDAIAAKKKSKEKKGKIAAMARDAASDEESGEKGTPKDKPGKKGKQDLKFSGLKLKGDLKKPDLSYIYKRRGVKDEQIVNIPTDFNDEIRQGENQF